jgi:hypothetical protein
MDSQNMTPAEQQEKMEQSNYTRAVKYSLTVLAVVVGIYAWGYIYTKGANAAGR